MNSYIDLHCDSLLNTIYHRTDDIFCVPEAMLDISRLQTADVMAQFFAIFFPDPTDELMTQLNTDEKYFQTLYHTFCNTLEKHSDVIRFAGNAGDIAKNCEAHLISALLTLEDGRMLDNSLDNLRNFYQMGVRLITLTWNFENCLGFPNSKDQKIMQKGLKPFGIETVQEMNRLGMLIDVSHLSDGGFWDVVKYSRKPFVASHSNCRSLCPHQRNLTDEMIRALANAGGIAGVNFAGHFLNKDVTDDHSSVAVMVEHVKYMIKLGGEDMVAIGSDFDGIGGDLEINEPGKLELLFHALGKAGLTARQIDKLATGNALRVIKETL